MCECVCGLAGVGVWTSWGVWLPKTQNTVSTTKEDTSSILSLDRLNMVTLSQRMVNDMAGWSEEVEQRKMVLLKTLYLVVHTCAPTFNDPLPITIVYQEDNFATLSLLTLVYRDVVPTYGVVLRSFVIYFGAHGTGMHVHTSPTTV